MSVIWPIEARSRKQPFIRHPTLAAFAGSQFVAFFAMVRRVRALDHFGDYAPNPAFSVFHDLSVRAFALHHDGIAKADVSRPLTDLVRRMMYIAEGSSVGLRPLPASLHIWTSDQHMKQSVRRSGVALMVQR